MTRCVYRVCWQGMCELTYHDISIEIHDLTMMQSTDDRRVVDIDAVTKSRSYESKGERVRDL